MVRGEIAVLMLGEVGDRACGVVRGDRCLMLRFRRSGFVGDEGAIAVEESGQTYINSQESLIDMTTPAGKDAITSLIRSINGSK